MTIEDGASNAAGEAKSLATKKIGPLPLVAWGGIAVVVFLLVARQRKAMAGPVVAADTSAGGVSAGAPYQTTGNLYGGVGQPINNNGEPGAIYTNDDWVHEAGKVLTLRNPTTATTVLRRLQAYTDGGTYPTDEYIAITSIADEGIIAVGPPPNPTGALRDGGTMPAPNVPVPTQPQPTVDLPGPQIDVPLPPPPAPAKGVVHFRIMDIPGYGPGWTLGNAADYYYGDHRLISKFYIATPGDKDPHAMTATDIIAAPPEGRIRD